MIHHITIFGCGFSGMITALSLANRNTLVNIIESKDTANESFCDDIRATALTPTTLEYFKKIFLDKEILNLSQEILNIYVLDNKAPEILNFSYKNVNEESIGYIINNKNFKKLLLKKIIDNPYINLIDKCSYQNIQSFENNTVIHLDSGSTIPPSDLLILCDGHSSSLRRKFFPAIFDKYYPQTVLTFHVQHEKNHEGTAVEHFLPTGPFAILPLQGNHNSSVVWTLKSNLAIIFQNMALEEMEYHVQKNFGEFLGKIKIISKVQSHPLKAYLTSRYLYNRIIVIAETAHIIHPLAGQGLNQGIEDIQALKSSIENSGISKDALKNYQKQRVQDNINMYQLTDLVNKMFSNSSNSLHLLRRAGLKIVDQLDPVKSIMIKYAMGRRKKLFS